MQTEDANPSDEIGIRFRRTPKMKQEKEKEEKVERLRDFRQVTPRKIHERSTPLFIAGATTRLGYHNPDLEILFRYKVKETLGRRSQFCL